MEPLSHCVVCHTMLCNRRKTCDLVARAARSGNNQSIFLRVESSPDTVWPIRAAVKRWNERSQDGGPIARANRMRSSQQAESPVLYVCGWKTRLTRFDQSEKRWNEKVKMAVCHHRSSVGYYSLCRSGCKACGRSDWLRLKPDTVLPLPGQSNWLRLKPDIVLTRH